MNSESVAFLLETLRLRTAVSQGRARGAWDSVDAGNLLLILRFEGAELWFYRRAQPLKAVIPEAVLAATRHAAHLTCVQNMRVDAQTIATISILRDASIPWALLKGQARRAAAARYPFASARAVSDVDLLVPEGRADEAWMRLCDAGFRRVYEEPTPWHVEHHRPALIDEHGVTVELHTTTCMAVPPAEAWRRAADGADHVSWNGLEVSVPSATELLWQGLAHGVRDGTRGYVLKTFLDVASILAADPAVNWDLVLRRFASGEVRDDGTERPVSRERMCRWLGVAADLAGTELPLALRPRRPVDLTSLLAWRSGVIAARLGESVKGRLLEEAARSETMQSISPSSPNVNPLRNLRHRSSSLVARLLYVAWKGGK